MTPINEIEPMTKGRLYIVYRPTVHTNPKQVEVLKGVRFSNIKKVMAKRPKDNIRDANFEFRPTQHTRKTVNVFELL